MESHKFTSFINVSLAVLLVVGIGMTVYAVTQVRDIKSEAKGNPNRDTSDPAKCLLTTTIRNQKIAVGETKTHSLTFCEGTNMVSYINWGNRVDADKNLALSATNPEGLKITEDDPYPQATQPLIFFGPSKEGLWKFEVTNNGSRDAIYDFSAGVSTN